MSESKLYDNFNGYNAYPAGIGEEMIRVRLSELFDKIIKKNQECLIKAKDMGMEKIMSRVLQVRTRTERMKKEMEHKFIGGEYNFDKISPSEEEELRETDLSLEKYILQAYAIIEPLTCLETDMHISEHFAQITNCFMEIEHLFHKRMDIFKKKRVYG
jgi:hypothetical protein